MYFCGSSLKNLLVSFLSILFFIDVSCLLVLKSYLGYLCGLVGFLLKYLGVFVYVYALVEKSQSTELKSVLDLVCMS